MIPTVELAEIDRLVASGWRTTGVCHEDIEPPVVFGHRIDEPARLIAVGDIRDTRKTLRLCLLPELLERAIDIVSTARTNPDPYAFGHEPPSDGKPQTLAGGGHRGHLAIESQLHQNSIPF